jgi:hypothetical protein
VQDAVTSVGHSNFKAHPGRKTQDNQVHPTGSPSPHEHKGQPAECLFTYSLLSSMSNGPHMLSMSYPNQETNFAREHICLNVRPKNNPIVIDIWASISVSPHQDDFVDGISTSSIQDLKGLNQSTKVEGMGMVEWTVYDVNNSIRKIRTVAFYVLDATIRLFSAQTYVLEGGERGHLHCDRD